MTLLLLWHPRSRRNRYGPGTIDHIAQPHGPHNEHGRPGHIRRTHAHRNRPSTPRIDRPTVGSID